MARNYFYDNDNVYTHFIDYPDGIQAPNATTVPTPDDETPKWKFNKELNVWELISFDLRKEKIIQQKFEIIDNQRGHIIFSGFPHQFPNGDIKMVQTRSEKDLIAVLGVTVSGMFLMQTDPSTKISFRSADDTTYQLNGMEAVQLGMNIQMQVSGVYERSWNKKEELRACTTIEEIEAVDLDISK